jgi:ABC-type nickel/cobalt efflux system permease component RcnA
VSGTSAYLLVLAVAVVGFLHTLVPDHWAPIALLARQRGWTPGQTVRAAAGAGIGHTLSTLAIAIVFWLAGAGLATHYAHLVATVSSVALILFGGWIALGSLREIRTHDRAHDHSHRAHAHVHRHDGLEHRHWHDHHEADWHASAGPASPAHEHAHDTSSRTALLLILGSSPMVEGIPAFFAAGRYGIGLLLTMSVVFALSTIVTYVVVCLLAAGGSQRVNLGPLERYGEVLSGAFIALLGIVFLVFPALP